MVRSLSWLASGASCLIYKQPVLQIVANDSVSPLLLRFIEKTVRAHCILLVRNVDKQPEHTIQIVLRFGEILYLAFSIRAYDFLSRHAANKEPVLFWIVGHSFRDQLRIAEAKRDRRIRRSRLLVRKLLPNLWNSGSSHTLRTRRRALEQVPACALADSVTVRMQPRDRLIRSE